MISYVALCMSCCVCMLCTYIMYVCMLCLCCVNDVDVRYVCVFVMSVGEFITLRMIARVVCLLCNLCVSNSMRVFMYDMQVMRACIYVRMQLMFVMCVR